MAPTRGWRGWAARVALPAFALAAVVIAGGLPAASLAAALPGPSEAPHPAYVAPAGQSSDGMTIGVTPSTVCAGGGTNCSASAGVARVSLSSELGTQFNFSSYQVAFVLDTTPYSGVYDSGAYEPGSDRCATASMGANLCEESNGIPFFVHNSTQIARAIQAQHPNASVSFALVDYFATLDQFDDGDGAQFHVDVANFTSNATQFGSEAVANFTSEAPGYTLADSDLSDNLLHSSSITAIYGAMVTGELHWSNESHHVIVWVGLTAPRDPGYAQNYSVSPSIYASFITGSGMSPGCEPSYNFSGAHSPWCVGWVNNSSPNSTTSLAALAQNATNCAGSLGGRCTVDTIDLWSTPTDPYSKGWPSGRYLGGPGGALVKQDTARVLEAGCDLANATGGSWEGPTFYTCPNGVTGHLAYVSGPLNFSNPTLLDALANVSFGAAIGAVPLPGQSMFSFVPVRPVELAPHLNATVTCTVSGAPYLGCPTTPTVTVLGGVTSLGWNWSLNRSPMPGGAIWSASFDVIVGGPPVGRALPLDACTTADCVAVEGAVSGITSGASYALTGGGGGGYRSFPLEYLTVAGPNPLSVALTVSPSPSIPVGSPVTLVATPSGGWGVTEVTWNLGDGVAAAGPSVTHVFGHPATYQVEATVHDAVGQWVNATASVAVGDLPLSSQLSVAPSVTTVGRPLAFTGAVGGGSGPTTFTWSGLPLGCYSVNASVLTCTPWSAGSYTVAFGVQDGFGESASSSVPILVHPAISVNVTATVGSGSCGGAGVPATFDAKAVGGTPGYTYLWRIGSGAPTGQGSTFSGTFAPGSTQIVSVTVTDTAGATGNGSLAINVPVPPCASGGGSSGSFSSLSSSGWELVVGLGAVAAGAIAAVLIARRRR